MKKDFYLKASSAVMCAAVAGSTAVAPILSNVAAEQVEDTQTENTETLQVENDEEVVTVALDTDVSDDQNDASEDEILVYVNGATSSVAFDKTQTLEEFMNKLQVVAGYDVAEGVVRIDYVEDDGQRIILRSGDEAADAENAVKTLADFYALVSEKNGLHIVLFNDSGEILRVQFNLRDGDDAVDADTVKRTQDVSRLVRYDANGGTLIGSKFVMRASGEKISYIETSAEYDRHTFDGWFDAKEGGNPVTEDTVVTSDMRVYAHWIADTIQLSFDTQGGNEIDPVEVSVDDTYRNLPTPVREGYTFKGWFDAAEGGKRVIAVKSDSDVTIYAQWTEDKQSSETPDDGNNNQKPDDVNNNQKPDDGNNNQKPDDGNNNQKPDDGNNNQKPDDGNNNQKPDDGNNNQKPDDGNNNQKPDDGNNNQKPDDGNNNQKPDDGNNNQKPDDGNNNQKPDDGNNNQKPDDGNNNQKPDDGNNNQKPDDGNNNQKPDNGNNNQTPDDGNNNQTPDNGNNNQTPDNGNNNQKPDNGNNNQTSDEVVSYKLTIVSADGNSTIATVKSTVELNALVQKLGYTNVASYKVKTATTSETSIDGTTTMKALADMAENGDVLIIAYDANGTAIGSGKVTKTASGEYRVSLSKDTNVALNNDTDDAKTDAEKTGEVSDKGKGEGEAAKTDTSAAAVKTADVSVVPLFGAMGSAMTSLLGAFAALKRRRR